MPDTGSTKNNTAGSGAPKNGRARRKRDRAFKKFYLKHRERIYWYIYRKISRPEESEDLTAEVFLKLYENWDSVARRGEKGLLAWLYTVARNGSIDFLRKAGRRKTRSIEDEEIDSATRFFDDFVGDAMKEEELARVKQALDGVEDVARDIMMLRFEEGLKFNEISEIVGKSEGACKMIMYRNIKKVRDKLTGEARSDGR